MKILFGIQGTGNGHISRAREIVPLLQQYGDVDLLVSGTEAEVSLSQPLKYKFHGFSFVFGKNGGVDNWATFKIMNLRQLWKDMHSLPLQDYDLIINDFEPVSAWACRLQKVPSVSLSHQCSFVSSKTPRPAKWNYAEWLFKYYSPTTHHIGFHFERYDDFIHTPVIRGDIRRMETSDKGHYSVYLPAYSDKTLVKHLGQTRDVEWHIFSKRQKTPYREGNVQIFPVNNEAFNASLASCTGLLTGGGFEGPAEALFLGKKVLMIPMRGQYEQQCNALSASKLGVEVIHTIGPDFVQRINNWLSNDKRIVVDFPDETAQIVDNMVKQYARQK
ncbi:MULTISPECIES: glycosyltransferase family protein [unclassified Mucilaginibacter]|uniref:glycosyltransferase family protein n=1 Tax=unclassified Mucilaginibacter TaxID=2617802 RepID=UPI000964F015|nr:MULTISPECIES: glycosyltransferase family protein [unclassified Mucilaginibacter]OJW16482.1 MAG: glycosyl transferase [Mucilaginibacter sp. 44-25]PLW88215.1 MAG: glycosyl transferase [Mucilaginibacter sp.]HEK20327.1 glycosyl transferase [Bacteroidota bacterium]